jgi:RNA polymerase sigma-70 factor (family 1)
VSRLSQQNDLDLFSLFKKGSKEAFDEMYSRYWQKLYNYAFHRTQSKDIAFEIVQDIFVSLWARKEIIQLQNSLSGYLFASVRFQIINHIKNSKLKELYLKDYVRFISSTDNSNEESMLAHDLHHALERSIDELPTRCREITRLNMLENWSTNKIADDLNISHRTVENQLALARKHLKASLGDFVVMLAILNRIL